MRYAAQGTIQVRILGKGVFRAFITPAPEYRVKHRDKDYTVLIGQNGKDVAREARACPAEQEYVVEDYLENALTEAANRGTKVEVEIEGDTYKIVAVTIPAAVPKH